MLSVSIPYRLLYFALALVAHGWQPHCHGGKPWQLQPRSLAGRLDNHHLLPGSRRGGFTRRCARSRPLSSSKANDDSGGGGSSQQPTPSGNEAGEECPSEEECEIDWDKMPGFADEETDNSSVQDQQKKASASLLSATDPPVEPMPKRKSSSMPVQPKSVESSRLRLEMMWQLDEAVEDCEVERPETCGSQPCETCRGRGVTPCRFCGGRQLLGFTRESNRHSGGSVSAFYACTICDHGLEPCGACRGTGWVAEWALLTPGTHTSPTVP